MNRRQVTLTVIAVLAALALIVIVTVALTGRQPSGPTASQSSSPSATSPASGSTEARNDATPTAPSTPAPDGAPDEGSQGDGATGGGGTNGETPGGGPSDPTPPVGPAPSPLFIAPLPATASAEGELTPGFPSQVVPLAPDSRVVASSLASESTRLQLGLTATSGISAARVIEHYQSVYGPLGFSSRPVDAVAGSTAFVFTRGDNAVTVTVYPVDPGSAYTVFGTFTVG